MNHSLHDSTVERVFDIESVGKAHSSPEDWRDHWIYFLLVDRFNNPDRPPASDDPAYEQYQGGTFEGIRRKLPYLKKLGVGALWLSPVLMNPQWFNNFWGGYCTMDFLNVEPRFCSDPHRAMADPSFADREFRALVDDIHASGMYVILDIVLNHAGDLFIYEGMTDVEPYNTEREYGVAWRDENGIPHEEWPDIAAIPNLKRGEGVWPVELQRNDYFRRRGDSADSPDPVRGDFRSLRELVTEYLVPGTNRYPVRDALIRAYQYLIGRFDLDGYRIDTLQYIETDFARIFGNSMREYALSIGKRNFFTFGEVWQDDDEAKIASYIGRNTTRDGEQIGVDAAIDFPMRKRMVAYAKGKISAAELVAHAELRKEILKPIVSSHGDASSFFVTFLDNHDLNERITCPGFELQTALALTCLMTMPGVPSVYYGTEQGLDGHGDRREYVREALWGQPKAFDEEHPFFKLISDLQVLRDRIPALRYGRLYFRQCSGDGVHFGYSNDPGGILAFSRILNDREVLVVGNASTTESITVHVALDWNLARQGADWEVLFESSESPVLPGKAETRGVFRTVQVTVPPMTAQVLRQARG